MKILHLTLTKQWFDLTAAGLKKNEYREKKDYWFKRLRYQDGKVTKFKNYDEIHYTNGYGKNRPFCRVTWNGCAAYIHRDRQPMYGEKLKGSGYYTIFNGSVLETRNWVNPFVKPQNP